jgi:nucleoside-diphosphate-sugar epimerase
MLVAISGGAGFLGLHLARRLLADGHTVRTLDVAPLDEPELERCAGAPWRRPRSAPLAEWHYRTAHRDSFVSVDKARRLLGWTPRFSNTETLGATYDWYLAHRESLGQAGTTHRVPWLQGVLGLVKRFS